MKLLFDGTVYQYERYHGGGEYSNAVFNELLKFRNQIDMEVFFDSDEKTTNYFFDLCKEVGMNLHPVSNPAQLRKLVEKGKYTKIYSALPKEKYFLDAQLPDNVNVTYTVHDLRSLELLNENMPPIRRNGKFSLLIDRLQWEYDRRMRYGALYPHYQWLLNGFKNKSIITVSQHSKYSIMCYYPEIEEKEIRVFYSPCKIVHKDREDGINIYEKYAVVDKGYGLIISADREEKNALRGMIAYDRLFSNGYQRLPSDYKVIVLGVNQKSEYLKYLKNPARFVFEDYVVAQELEFLYQHAQLFLYPTLNEGFGYPPLEAMKYGTLSACSAVSSIPEICGNAVLYFNPMRIEEIENRILQSFDKDIVAEKSSEMNSQYQQVNRRQKEDLEKLTEFLVSDCVIS